MKLNKYLIVDHLVGTDHKLKLKVITGFSRDDMKEAIDVKEDWKPLGNDQDKLFFFPGANVPRFKVRERFACTTKLENATAAFVSSDSMTTSDLFIHYKDLCPVDKVDIFDTWMSNVWEEHISILYKSLRDSGITKVFLTKNLWYNQYDRGFHKYDSTLNEVKCILGTYAFDYIKHHNNNQLFAVTKKAINSFPSNLFFENVVLSKLNTGNFIIDKTKYAELRNFGQSKEVENQILLMELMSNCDFEKSTMNLLLLIKEFGGVMIKLKEKDHVNFKSLLSYLGVPVKKLNELDIMMMTDILRAHGIFTKSNAQTLSMMFLNERVFYAEESCWAQGPVLKNSNYLND
jgi:hypothetical protein